MHHVDSTCLQLQYGERLVDANLLALNSGSLALLNGLLGSLALLEEGLGDQDLLSGGGGAVSLVSPAVK